MPFLAGAAAPLIGAGASIVGGLIGGKGGSKEQKNILKNINAALPKALYTAQGDAEKSGMNSNLYRDLSMPQISQGAEGIKSGYQGVDYGADLLNQSGEYFRGILGGGSALDALLGPQREAITRNYQNSLDTIARGTRGGGGLAAIQNFEFNKNRDLMNLIPGARAQAAAGLAGVGSQIGQLGSARSQIGQALGQLGINTANVGASYQGLANQNVGNIIGQAQTGAGIAGQRAAAGTQLGQDLGDLFGPILLDIFNGKKGSDQGIGTYAPGGYLDPEGIFRSV